MTRVRGRVRGFLVALMVAALPLLGCAGIQSEASGSAEADEAVEESAVLSDLFVETGQEGLLIYAGDALDELWYPEFTLVDAGLLITESFYSELEGGCEQFVLLDLSEGTAVTTEFACEFLTDVRQTDAGIMLCDSCLGIVTLLDDALQAVQTWDIEANYEFWYVSPDGQSVYIIDDNTLTRVYLDDLDGDAEVILSSSVSLYGTTATSEGVNITYVDDDSQLTLEVWLDLASGELSTLEVGEAVYGLAKVGDVWLASLGYSSSAGCILGTVDEEAEAEAEAEAENAGEGADEGEAAAAEEEAEAEEEVADDAAAAEEEAEAEEAADGEADDAAASGLYYVAFEGDDLMLVAGSDYLLAGTTEYLYDEDDEETLLGAVSTFVLYDSDGTFVASFELEGEDVWYYGTYCVYSDVYGGCFLLIYREEGVQLYFWAVDDLREARDAQEAQEELAEDEAAADDAEAAEDEAASSDLALITLEEYEQTPGGTAVDASLYERAAALGEAYGVEILIADQCATEYTDFVAELVTGEDLISAALDILEEALSAYPDGFIEQLKYDKMTHIQISLVGTLTPTNDNWGDESYNGLTEEAGSVYLMVFDLNQLYTDTVYHEFSHIIDQKLTWDAYCREDALFSEETWASLNPEGFEYVYVYSGFADLVFEGDEYLYFIDSYSMVSPTEDRARIMEFAMAGYDWYFTEYEPTYAKLLYYAACIRDAFDTTGWPEKTAWEDVG